MSSPQTIEEIANRLRRVEDELAVQHLLVEYGLAVDAGDRTAFSELLAEDAVYELDTLRIVGRAAIVEAVFSGEHGAVHPMAAHTIGPVTVDIQGEHATARGYSRLYVVQNEEIVLWRLSLNRFELVRQGAEWRISRRVTRLLGSPECAALIKSR